VKFINESTYSHRRGLTHDPFKSHLQKVLDFTPIAMVFLCTVNISLLLDELTTQNYFEFHYRAKNGEGWGTESLKCQKNTVLRSLLKVS
jgi:hypothetical protein